MLITVMALALGLEPMFVEIPPDRVERIVFHELTIFTPDTGWGQPKRIERYVQIYQRDFNSRVYMEDEIRLPRDEDFPTVFGPKRNRIRIENGHWVFEQNECWEWERKYKVESVYLESRAPILFSQRTIHREQW